MRARPEERYPVDFQVFLTWEKNSVTQRVVGRCVDLSPSGARLETRDKLEAQVDRTGAFRTVRTHGPCLHPPLHAEGNEV